jgi:uncharacterized protein with von Willebrand factor type A (vWA) domain
LIQFRELLRGAGLRPSPAEWLDALRAVEAVGLAGRERFRLALRAALVKRASDRAAFDSAFERFFAAPSRPARVTRGATGEPGPRTRPSDEPPERRCGVGRRAGPPRALVTQLERALRGGGPAAPGRLRRIVSGASAAGRLPPRPALASRSVSPERLDLRRRLVPAEERAIAAAVPRLAERIRLRASRRRARAARGRLDLRRVFRENLAHGGVPFALPRRRARRRPARVVLLIDVSWSTARAAGLFLTLAHEFLRRAAQTRVLLFVDRSVDASAAVARWMRRGPRAAGPFAGLLESIPGLNLDAPSDYGRAFHNLLRSPLRPAGRRTLLVVLGDGRTNRFDAQDWAFAELVERCGAALWLVPEARAEWGTGDSALEVYLPRVDVAVEAHDLAGLARGIAVIARRIGRR